MDNFRKYIYLVFIGKYIKKIIVCSVVFLKGGLEIRDGGFFLIFFEFYFLFVCF